jgi:hypothetical protein
MEFAAKGRLIAAANWAIAGIGAAIAVYVFAFIFSVPPDGASGQIASASGNESAPAANAAQPVNSAPTNENTSARPVLRPNVVAGNSASKAKPAPAAQIQSERPTQAYPQTLPPGAGRGF